MDCDICAPKCGIRSMAYDLLALLVSRSRNKSVVLVAVPRSTVHPGPRSGLSGHAVSTRITF
jgi:hypothetical protein